jgi:tetratricopeptide (TPR) repeat protein
MSASPKESLVQGIDLVKKALSLNEKDAINHAALAYLLVLTGEYDKGVARAERALALDADSFSVLHFSGLAFLFSCKGKEAIAALEKAEQLNPSIPYSSLHLSWAYRFTGQYEEAFKQAQKAVERNPHNLLCQLALTATCNLTGREAEARAAAKEVLKLSPNFTLERIPNYDLFKDKSQFGITVDALCKAGLK